MGILAVKHNIEVAHRLFLLPGKCENIHGHSMNVTLYLKGAIDDKGILGGVEFGELKHAFRTYLDSEYDHHLLLNGRDPWAWKLAPHGASVSEHYQLPGLVVMPGDPTTENIAKWIYQEMSDEVRTRWPYAQVDCVEVWETAVNMAAYGGEDE